MTVTISPATGTISTMVASDRTRRDRAFPRPLRARSGFTLLEMLVVVAIISIMVGVIGYGFLRGSSGATVGLQTSQSILVALLTQARSQAILTGRDAAVLVNNNPNNAARYRRYLCVVVRDDTNAWQPMDVGVYLPEGSYVLPPSALGTSEVDGGLWTNVLSGVLESEPSDPAIESTTAEEWLRVGFNARGMLLGGVGSMGNLVVASGRPQPPDSVPPFIYTNPRGVRGIAITVYGLTRLLNDAGDFGT